MYQVQFLIISHHVTPNVMCHVSSRARSSQLARQTALATTRSRMCPRPSLSLLKILPIPMAETEGLTERCHLVFEFQSGVLAHFRILSDILFR